MTTCLAELDGKVPIHTNNVGIQRFSYCHILVLTLQFTITVLTGSPFFGVIST